MADTSDVDAAIMAKLQGDATLMAIVPDGVYWDIAAATGPTGAETTKFVIVSHVEHEDAHNLPNHILWERFVYAIKAVTRGSSGTDVKAAAARIHTLLQDQTLSVSGYYAPMVMQRVGRVRYVQVDETTNLRWQHRGGHYEVIITPH